MFYVSNMLNHENLNIIIFFIIVFILTWFLIKAYKILIFLYAIIVGKSGEKRAKALLNINGYKILKEQFTIKGQLFENKELRNFLIKPDYLVLKNNITYIAEVKTGDSASIKNRFTRRQLLEYSIIYKSKKILLIDIDNNKISTVEFF